MYMAASLGLGHEAYYAYPAAAASSCLPPDNNGAVLELPPAAAAADCYFPELSACCVTPDDYYHYSPPPAPPVFAGGSARGNELTTNMLSYVDDGGRRTSSAAGTGGGRASSRIGFRTRSEVDVLDDGFRWRKYGKKAVKSSPNPRNYYRCSAEGCGVKKRVERDSDDPRCVVTTYDGVHNHAPPGAGGASLVSPPRGAHHQRHASMCSAAPPVAAPWTAPAGLDGGPLYAAAAAAHSSESSY